MDIWYSLTTKCFIKTIIMCFEYPLKASFQGMHLATSMHSRLWHLLYNHVICIVRVSREVRFVKGGRARFNQGGEILSRGWRDFVKGGRDFVKGGVPLPFK